MHALKTLWLLPVVTLLACAPAAPPDHNHGHQEPSVEPTPAAPQVDNPPVQNTTPKLAPELGDPSKTDSVKLSVLLTQGNGLATPRDLAFNPLRPDELWVVNLDGSAVIAHSATGTPESERRRDAAADHFMPRPSSIAFGGNATTASVGKQGTFATCPESTNGHDTTPGNYFMGPVLWSSDLSIFAVMDPNGLGSHLDMLHKSPNCMGIAWESDNIYWTFTGYDNSIIRYDFGLDHGIGNDNHKDGLAWRYALSQVKYVPGIPSHLVYDGKAGLVYVADTGNQRIAKLDPFVATVGSTAPSFQDDGILYQMNNADLEDVVTLGSGLLSQPSGLEVHNGLIYVSDSGTGKILAFTPEGKLVNYLDTKLPTQSLAGINFGPDGKLYFVDMKGHRVFRVDVQ
jgi:DNA-binding beta-propeller fold protein YncE